MPFYKTVTTITRTDAIEAKDDNDAKVIATGNAALLLHGVKHEIKSIEVTRLSEV